MGAHVARRSRRSYFAEGREVGTEVGDFLAISRNWAFEQSWHVYAAWLSVVEEWSVSRYD